MTVTHTIEVVMTLASVPLRFPYGSKLVTNRLLSKPSVIWETNHLWSASLKCEQKKMFFRWFLKWCLIVFSQIFAFEGGCKSSWCWCWWCLWSGQETDETTSWVFSLHVSGCSTRKILAEAILFGDCCYFFFKGFISILSVLSTYNLTQETRDDCEFVFQWFYMISIFWA